MNHDKKQSGRFLFWTWRSWNLGTGADWKFRGQTTCPGSRNPLRAWRRLQIWWANVFTSRDGSGRFLLWTWESWSIGGGAGVNWWFMGLDVSPGEYSPLWCWFEFVNQEIKSDTQEIKTCYVMSFGYVDKKRRIK